MFKAMLEDVLSGMDIKAISQNFHETLVDNIQSLESILN